jgi:hypothetical protein
MPILAKADQSMFKGTVSFSARIRGNGLTFPLFTFNPSDQGVDKVNIEGPNGEEILSTVHLASIPTRENGISLATEVNTAALNRISFCHDIAIENARITNTAFSQVPPQSDAHLEINVGDCIHLGDAVSFVLGLDPTHLKTELEQASHRGEQYFGLYRSARQSGSPVEEFMNLYQILMILFNDSQRDIDAFIVCQEPAVPQTQHPKKPTGTMETIYSRLRNEFGHDRQGVNLDNTKKDMAACLGGLIAITKRAIELKT